MSSSVSSRHSYNPSRTAIAISVAGPPGTACPPPDEVTDIRLQDVQGPFPPRIGGHRPAGAQRAQPGRDLVGEFLIVFQDEQRGRDLLRLGGKFGVPKERLGQQDGPLVIGQLSLPGAHNTIMPAG
jgi:hypothetical protein